jgi:hypothetical protein
MGIINAIRAGKASDLKKPEMPISPRPNDGDEGGFKFALRKVTPRAVPEKEPAEQPLTELQKKLNNRRN